MAPRNVASGVAVSFGLITASVALASAVDKGSSGNVTVCDAGHAPQRIRCPKVCPVCGEVPDQQLKKARPVEGGVVLLTEKDLNAAGKEAAKFKKTATVSAHPADQVEVLTVAGEKAYYLVPEKGHEAPYAALLGLVSTHPELAFMTQWTPWTTAAQFRLRAHEGSLMLQERTRAGQMRPAPELDLGDNAALIDLAEKVLAMPDQVVDYDPVSYADAFQERLDKIVATKEVVAAPDVVTTTSLPPTNVTDLMARLEAQVGGKKRRKKVS